MENCNRIRRGAFAPFAAPAGNVLKHLVLAVAALCGCGLESFGGVSPAVFTKHVAITLAAPNLSEGGAIGEVPVLVRLSTAIEGFSYADFGHAEQKDLLFTLADGTSLSHEIESWDAEGESLVWVRVPDFQKGMVLHCYYGGGTDSQNTPAATWSSYGGVWHFAEASGTAYDATANGFDGEPAGDYAAEIVATASPVGTGRYQSGKMKCYLEIPDYSRLGYGNSFAVSLWVKTFESGFGGLYPKLLLRSGGWGLQFENDTSRLTLQGNYSGAGTALIGKTQNTWKHITVVYGPTTVACYTNGVLCTELSMKWPARDVVQPLLVGYQGRSGYGDLKCSYDELRLTGTTPSAERIAASYQAMSDAAFCAYGTVGTQETVPVCDAPVVVRNDDGSYDVTVTLVRGSGTVALVKASGDAETVIPLSDGSVAAPREYTVRFSADAADEKLRLAADTGYRFVARGITGSAENVDVDGPTILVAAITVAKTADATPSANGVFTVSRPDAAAACLYDLVVPYEVSGSAVAGEHYKELAGTVTIPAGAASATVEVKPLALESGSTELTLTLLPGLYSLGTPSAATMEVACQRSAATLDWVGGSGAHDFNAAANWSPAYRPDTLDTLNVTAAGEEDYALALSRDTKVATLNLKDGTDATAAVAIRGEGLALDVGTKLAIGTQPVVFDGFTGAVAAWGVGSTYDVTYRNGTSVTNAPFDSKDNAHTTLDGSHYLSTGWIYGAGTNQTIRIANGAVVDVFYAMQPSISQSTIVVTDSMITNRSRAFAFSKDDSSKYVGNTWALTNAVINNGGGVYASFTRVTAHNCTFGGCPSISGNSTNSVVILTGGESVVNGVGSSLGGISNRLEFVGVSATKINANNSFSFGEKSRGNLLRIDSAAFAKWIFATRTNSYDNTILAENGGSVSFSRCGESNNNFAFNGQTNRWVAKNGTFTSPNKLSFSERPESDGCEIALEGDEAVVSLGDNTVLGTNDPNAGDAILSFTPGATGFGGVAPLRFTGSGSYRPSVRSNVVIRVDARAWVAGGGKDVRRAALPLLRFQKANPTQFDVDRLALRLRTRPASGFLEYDTATRTLWWKRLPGSAVILR